MEEDYISWLYFNVMNGPGNRFNAYKRLYLRLLETPYRYTHPMDKNRFKDGLELRGDYFEYDPDNCMWIDVNYEDCTVLEMLVALSYRMEKDIMASASGDFDCFRWFWGMIEHLRLDTIRYNGGYYIEIDDILENFLDRKYDSSGENGGLFPLQNCEVPAYEMEVWSQMNEFLCENYV